MVRLGSVIELCHLQVNAIAFDKTGTITEGKPSVTNFIIFSSLVPCGPLLAVIGAAESSSEHPIGKAIFSFVSSNFDGPNRLPKAENFRATVGLGLECDVVMNNGSVTLPKEAKGQLGGEAFSSTL